MFEVIERKFIYAMCQDNVIRKVLMIDFEKETVVLDDARSGSGSILEKLSDVVLIK